MEALFALTIIGLFVFIGSLSSRISKLEREVYASHGVHQNAKDRDGVTNTSSVSEKARVSQAVQTVLLERQPAGARKEGIEHESAFNPLTWLAKDWPLKLGAAFLLIGFGWFVMYAIANNMVSQEMRIGLGVAAGVLFMVFGLLRMRQFVDQGSIFLVLGAGIALSTMYAGVVLYHFFTPFTVLLSTCAVGVVIAGASVRYSRKDLGILSVIVVGIAPFLTNAQSGDPFTLTGYGGVVVLLSLAIMVLRGFKEPVLAALMVELVYMAVVSDSVHGGAILMVAYLLLSYAFCIGLAHAWAVVRHGKRFPHDVILSVLNAVITVGAVLAFVPDALQSVVMLVATMVTAAFAYFTWAELRNRELMTLYSGISIIFLGLATALEYEGVVLLALFALEAFAVIVMSYMLTGKDIVIARRVSTTLVVSFIVSLQYLVDASDSYTAYTFFAVALGYACLVYYFFRDAHAHITPSVGEWLVFLSGVGMYFVFAGCYMFFIPTTSFIIATAVAACVYVYALRSASDAGTMSIFALCSFLVPVLATMQYIGTPFTSVLLVAFSILAASLTLAGGFVAANDQSVRISSGAAIVLGGIIFLYTIWHVLTDMIYTGTPSFGVLVALVLYTVMGLAAYIYGKQNDVLFSTRAGQVLIGFVIARLLLVDVWNMDLAIRVATFSTIGALLMGTTFLSKEKRTQ